jgi:hypothetical protein
VRFSGRKIQRLILRTKIRSLFGATAGYSILYYKISPASYRLPRSGCFATYGCGKGYKEMYGAKKKVVFIGPCIAKKNESGDPDIVLTFKEIRNIFDQKEISPEKVESLPFDPPYSGRGAIFPISRGIINTINIQENLVQGNIIVAEVAKL